MATTAELKCVVNSGKIASKDVSTDYAGHQVFFCCKGCKAKFEKNPATYTTQANFQLVASGQVSQTACPFSGGDLNDDQFTQVNGVTVKYCCGKCKAKMETAQEAQQLEFVFGEKGFKKGFETE